MAKTIAQYYAEGVENPFTQQGLDERAKKEADEKAEKAIRQQRVERNPKTVEDYVLKGSETPFTDQARGEMGAAAAQKAKIKRVEDSARDQVLDNIQKGPIRYAGFAKGGKVSSASSRADGIAQRGKTRGKFC